jgi:hypothetical protein
MADKDFKVKAGIDLGSPLPIAEGGTGQTTANNALNALLPVQTSASGKVLQSDGTSASWGSLDGLPSQNDNANKFLTTNGSTASWSTVNTDPTADIFMMMGA